MNMDMLVPLVKTSLRAPRDAAEQLLGFSLSREVLWTALALVSVFNTFLMVALFNLSPPPPETSGMPPVPDLFYNPLPLFIMQTGVLVVFVHALYWTGKSLGGTGELADMLTLTIWFSALSGLLRLVTLVLMLVVPVMAQLFSIIAFFWSLWILLTFIHTGMRLPNIGYAIATLVVGSLGMAFGLVILFVLIVVLATGVVGNV